MSSSNDANGESGSGIRLPPISFLSGNQESLRKPGSAGFGISSFLNSNSNENNKPQEANSSNERKENEGLANLPSLLNYTDGQDVKDEQPITQPTEQNNTEITTSEDKKEKLVPSESEKISVGPKIESEAEIHDDQQQDFAEESDKSAGNNPVDQEHYRDVESQHNLNELTNNDTIESNQSKHFQNTPVLKEPPVTLETGPIFELIKELFPNRRNLGTIVYNPTTTLQTLQTAQLVGLNPEDYKRFEEIKSNFREKTTDPYYKNSIKYIPNIPPLADAYINSLIEIKIPARHIRRFLDSMESNGEVVRKREVWGGAGGVYTDDSDILPVLCHMGLFNDKIDLSEWNKSWKKLDITSLINNDDNEIADDLAVEVLLLPRLPQYYGYYSNGINSRSWVGRNKHDGLSIAIYNVRWETSGSYLRDPKLFKRFQIEANKEYKVSKDFLSKSNWKITEKYYNKIKEKINKDKASKSSPSASS